MITRVAASIFCALSLAAPAQAAQCGGDFNAFLSAFSREAAAQKISPQVIQTAFAGLTPDPRVIQLDQRQGVFKFRQADDGNDPLLPHTFNNGHGSSLNEWFCLVYTADELRRAA